MTDSAMHLWDSYIYSTKKTIVIFGCTIMLPQIKKHVDVRDGNRVN